MFEFWRFQTVDETQYTLLHGEFTISLVILSVLVSSMAAYSSLIVIERMWYSNNPKTVQLWRVFGSIVFGLGVWAMHFTGMLAFMIPMPMSYDSTLTILSLFPPIIGAFFAFQILYRQQFTLIDMLVSALCLALGIGSMHYIGMEAMQMDVLMVYSFGLFLLSIVVAFIFASIAIYLIKLQHQYHSDNLFRRILVATVMGISVAGMHYTAMTAVSFYASHEMGMIGEHMSNTLSIALVVAFFVVIIFAATVLCSIVDSRLQAAESTLEASLSREKDIVNNLADGLIIVDSNGIIDSINLTGLNMFGFEESETKGKNLEDLMPSFNKQSLNNSAQSEHEHRSNLTMEGIKHNGNSFPIEVSLSTMSLQHDGKTLFNCVVRDISARLELEQQLRQSQKLESMGQLAAGIAHEINTPTQYVSDNTVFLKDAFQSCLTAISAIKTLSEQSTKEPSDNYPQEIIGIIEENDLDFVAEEIPLALDQSLEGLQRISKIVRAMKSFSHSSNHEMQQVDIAEAIESTVTIARSEWRYVAKVETDFDSSLPSIPCYRDEFNQVILNFIINAAHAIEEKFSDSDTLGLIKVTTSSDGEYAIIAIEDNGTGIPDKIVNRIFDPFFTTKDVGKGTGQGLNLAYSCIVELHGGLIQTDTTPGEGTTFTIKLPLNNQSAQSEQEVVDENPIS
ncbi:MHYT domain-containing protein [Vibrio paucivorans]|uniref:histidine kinase n=1 Tax=Vibrio paucivorans TaxID=2829489 RepID=A0A9X3HSI8_9VIBR|nr:MHYT domain-containing protein [Vibrio paucivorans]MCW8334841.1 ATP-binding protein [Vibrio paucivorans]